MPKKETTIDEVLGAVYHVSEAVQLLATQMDERFNQVDKRFDRLEGRVGKIEATMVTKDYLDEKLHDLRGDLIVMMRKEDTKLNTLADILHKRDVITDNDIKKLSAMEPFAKM